MDATSLCTYTWRSRLWVESTRLEVKSVITCGDGYQIVFGLVAQRHRL